MPKKSRSSRSNGPPIDTTYAWRLLAEEVGPGVGPATPACNVSFSPLSLHVSASILAAGSSVSPAEPPAVAATLRSRLLSFLGSNGFGRLPDKTATSAITAAAARSGDGLGVFFSNKLWLKRRLFVGHNELSWESGRYGSLISLADFENDAAKLGEEANTWLRETCGTSIPKHLIPKDSVCADTEFIVGNVLTFFGDWASELGLELDTTGVGEKGRSEFYRLDGHSLFVPFMTSKEPQWIASYPGFKALRMPYKKGKDERQFAMYVFLPDDRDGVFKLLDKLATESGFLERHLPKEKVPIGEFKVPIKRGTLADSAMGVVWPPPSRSALEKDDVSADPTHDPFHPYCFSSFIFINFSDETENCENEKADETGKNEKADETYNGENAKGRGKEKAIVLESAGESSYGGTPVDFVADHAFLFAIIEDVSKTVLMTGHVHNPVCGDPDFRGACSAVGIMTVGSSSEYEESNSEDDIEEADDDIGDAPGAHVD